MFLCTHTYYEHCVMLDTVTGHYLIKNQTLHRLCANIRVFPYYVPLQVQSIGVSNKTMGANIKLANSMSTTAKTMTDMNKIMKPEQVAADMRAFSQASTKMDMTDEMSKYNLKSSDSLTLQSQRHTRICHSGCLCIIPQISSVPFIVSLSTVALSY